MSFRTRRRVILVKQEVTYGTDAAPTDAANAVLARSVSVTPLAGDDISRDLIRSYFGNSQMLAGDKHVEMELEIELAGSGTAGTAPAWAPLLRACGFAEVLVAATSATYNPITGGETSVTVWVHRDGNVHKFTGARGTVRFGLSVNQIPTMTFRFLGLYTPVAAATIPATPTLTAWRTPQVVNSTNTTSFTLHSVATSFSEFSIDAAVNVVKHQVVGPSNSIIIVDRAPSGSITIEEPVIGTLDTYALSLASTRVPLSLVHGTGAGNIFTITAPQVGIGSPSEADLNGVQMLTLPLTFSPNTGNDELILALT